MQIYGSLYHGENGGFDFYFLMTAIIPILFFDKKIYYLSLFVLSIFGFIMVKELYEIVTPEVPFPYKMIIPYYTNIVLTGFLIYLGYELFKSEHLKYEKELKQQKEDTQHQKDTLSKLKEQLEELLQTRTEKVEEQKKNINKYAFLNAHKARSPLARILGLINLTHFEDLSNKETRDFYLKELKSNAKALDEVLSEISYVLNEDVKNR